jgi:hypothetical protein
MWRWNLPRADLKALTTGRWVKRWRRRAERLGAGGGAMLIHALLLVALLLSSRTSTLTGGVAGDERGAVTVSMVHDLPGDVPKALGLAKDSTALQKSGVETTTAPDQTPSQNSLNSQSPAKPSAAGARQAVEDAHSTTDGPEKPAPDAQPNPWAQASFLAARDQHASSLWQDVQPCWKADKHGPAFQMRVLLDAQGDLVRADVLRDHSVLGPNVNEAALDQALDALQACAPYSRFAGAQRAYDVKFPG